MLCETTYGLTEQIAEHLLHVAEYTKAPMIAVAVEDLDRLLEWKN
jgi:hypothetical protein